MTLNLSASEPNSIPVPLVKRPFPGTVKLCVTDSVTEYKAKPAGVHGFETAWTITLNSSDLQGTA
jgi:hypothetical protein